MAPRDLIELPEEAMAEFEAKTEEIARKKQAEAATFDEIVEKGLTDIELKEDPKRKQRLALSAEAKSATDRITHQFRRMKPPYDTNTVSDLILKLRRYEFELTEAFDEARERDSVQFDLPLAKEERTAIQDALSDVRLARVDINTAVSRSERERERRQQTERERTEDAVDAQLAFMDELEKQSEIRRKLQRNELDTDARGELEDMLQARAEAFEARINELNQLADEGRATNEQKAQLEAANTALKDVQNTIHALFQADRVELRRKKHLAEAPKRAMEAARRKFAEATDEEISEAIDRGFDEARDLSLDKKIDETLTKIQQQAKQKGLKSKTIDPEVAELLAEIQAEEQKAGTEQPEGLLTIPGDFEATKQKLDDVVTYVDDVRETLSKEPEPETSMQIRAMYRDLKRVSDELDERLERLWLKDDLTDTDKKEFEMIADAKHLIQDALHEIRSYEQDVPVLSTQQTRKREREQAERQVQDTRKEKAKEQRREQLERVEQSILNLVRNAGIEEPAVYLNSQGTGFIGKTKRALTRLFGEKPLINQENIEALCDRLATIEDRFWTSFYSKEERKEKNWREICERAPLYNLSVKNDVFEIWNALEKELHGDVKKEIPKGSAHLEDIKEAMRDTKAAFSTTRAEHDRETAWDYRTAAGLRPRPLTGEELEREYMGEAPMPRDPNAYGERLDDATSARIKKTLWRYVKDPKSFVRTIEQAPTAEDLKWSAPEMLLTMADIIDQCRSKNAREKRARLNKLIPKLTEMHEHLLEHGITIEPDPFESIMKRASRELEKSKKKPKKTKTKTKKTIKSKAAEEPPEEIKEAA